MLNSYKQFYKELLVPSTRNDICYANKRATSVSTPEELLSKLITLNKEKKDLYFLGGIDPEAGDRPGDDEMLLKHSLVFDFDEVLTKKERDEKGSHGAPPLQREHIDEIVRSLKPPFDQYYAIARSGRGIHIYYKSPEIIDVEGKKERWKAGAKHFFNMMDDMSPYVCCHPNCNTGRIFRLPGSFNYKQDKTAFCHLIYLDYTARADFLLDILNIDPEVEERVVKTSYPTGNEIIDYIDNMIPIENLVCERYNYSPGKRGSKDWHFFDNESQEHRGCFYDPNTNFFIPGESHKHFKQTSHKPFHFIQYDWYSQADIAEYCKEKNLKPHKQNGKLGLPYRLTIKFFIKKYPQLKNNLLVLCRRNNLKIQ